MNTTILLVALVVFAFAISRVLTRYAARYFVVSGVEYILLGVLLGPVTGVLQHEALHTFEPLIALLLGLLGFVQGLRARELLVKPRVLLLGTLSSLLVIAFTGAACLMLIEAIGEGAAAVTYGSLPLGDRLLVVAASPDNLRIAGTIGCCAAVSSPMRIADSARVLRARGPARDALIEQGQVSQMIALFAFGGILATARATESAAELQVPVGMWTVGIALFGILAGLLFIQFIGSERDEMRIYIAAVGVVTFASGIGVALEVSPLVVNLIAGACVSLDPRYAKHLDQTLTRLRHPSLVLIRVFAGAAWVGVRGLAWLLPPLYAAVRLGARGATGRLVLRPGPDGPAVPRLGLGLLGQGGFAVAIALSYAMRFPERAGVVLTVVLGGLVLSDLWSHRAVRRVLADAGEVHAITEAEQAAEAEAEARAQAEREAHGHGGHGHHGAHDDHEALDDHHGADDGGDASLAVESEEPHDSDSVSESEETNAGVAGSDDAAESGSEPESESESADPSASDGSEAARASEPTHETTPAADATIDASNTASDVEPTESDETETETETEEDPR